jgi:hypothetical protein
VSAPLLESSQSVGVSGLLCLPVDLTVLREVALEKFHYIRKKQNYKMIVPANHSIGTTKTGQSLITRLPLFTRCPIMLPVKTRTDINVQTNMTGAGRLFGVAGVAFLRLNLFSLPMCVNKFTIFPNKTYNISHCRYIKIFRIRWLNIANNS